MSPVSWSTQHHQPLIELLSHRLYTPSHRYYIIKPTVKHITDFHVQDWVEKGEGEFSALVGYGDFIFHTYTFTKLVLHAHTHIHTGGYQVIKCIQPIQSIRVPSLPFLVQCGIIQCSGYNPCPVVWRIRPESPRYHLQLRQNGPSHFRSSQYTTQLTHSLI